MTRNCPTCGAWRVRNGHFCWQCGQPLAVVGFGSMPAGPVGAAPMRSRTPVTDNVWRVAALGLGAGCGVLFADWDPAWIAIVLMGYILLGPAGEFLGTLFGKIPPMEFGKGDKLTLRVEHHETSDKGKKFVDLYDMPDTIGLEHLQWIAGKVLPEPEGEGRAFSRRQVCKVGKLSQLQFETIRDEWLNFYRNPAAPQQGPCFKRKMPPYAQKSAWWRGGGWLR